MVYLRKNAELVHLTNDFPLLMQGLNIIYDKNVPIAQHPAIE